MTFSLEKTKLTDLIKPEITERQRLKSGTARPKNHKNQFVWKKPQIEFETAKSKNGHRNHEDPDFKTWKIWPSDQIISGQI